MRISIQGDTKKNRIYWWIGLFAVVFIVIVVLLSLGFLIFEDTLTGPQNDPEAAGALVPRLELPLPALTPIYMPRSIDLSVKVIETGQDSHHDKRVVQLAWSSLGYWYPTSVRQPASGGQKDDHPHRHNRGDHTSLEGRH